MKQLFEYLCMNCWEKAVEGQTEYRGIVNLNVDKTVNGIVYLYHRCFTCKTEQTIRLDPQKEEDIIPMSSEQLIRNRNKKFKQTKES